MHVCILYGDLNFCDFPNVCRFIPFIVFYIMLDIIYLCAFKLKLIKGIHDAIFESEEQSRFIRLFSMNVV